MIMKKIVIINRQCELAKPLINLLTKLFPECEIDIIPGFLDTQEKTAKALGNTYRTFTVEGKT